MRLIKKTYTLKNLDAAHVLEVGGVMDGNIRTLERSLGVRIYRHHGSFEAQSNEGATLEAALWALERMDAEAQQSQSLGTPAFLGIVNQAQNQTQTQTKLKTQNTHKAHAHASIHTPLMQVRAKTPVQAHYMHTMHEKMLTFGVGPAGSGKSFLAVARAVASIVSGETKRLVMVRPMLEAGERMGFLPGDMQEKIDPYLRPIYDALALCIGSEAMEKWQARGMLEVAPLAFMRGRTLSDVFVILDEAQNTTKAQMKMFLSRMGHGSKVVVTGDVSQSDLPSYTESGLAHVLRILPPSSQDVGVVRLSSDDVVRHSMVKMILNAYELDEASAAAKNKDRQEYATQNATQKPHA